MCLLSRDGAKAKEVKVECIDQGDGRYQLRWLSEVPGRCVASKSGNHLSSI